MQAIQNAGPKGGSECPVEYHNPLLQAHGFFFVAAVIAIISKKGALT